MYQKNALNWCLEYDNSTRKIWWMNIGVPETLVENTEYFFPKLDFKNQSIITATEQLCLHQASCNDIVILRTKPVDEVMQCVKANGKGLPTILYVQDLYANMSESIAKDQVLLTRIKSLINNEESSYILVPFKVTKYDYIISNILGVDLCGNIPESNVDINDKIVARKISQELAGHITEGYECYDVQDVQNAIKCMYPKDSIVVKEYDGVSGQGLFIIRDTYSLNLMNIFLQRHEEEKKFRLLVEKWYSDCISINYQICITKDGKNMQFFPTIQLVNAGVYMGTDFQIEDYLDEDDLAEIYKFGNRLAVWLYKKGYYGNVSIDAIKTKEEFFHLIEINARFSLSSYYLATARKYSGKKIIIQYYNINTINFSIHEFYKIFCKKSGVLILSFGENQIEKKGRVFLLFFADKCEELQLTKLKVEAYLGVSSQSIRQIK